jgi:hypothetical protein
VFSSRIGQLSALASAYLITFPERFIAPASGAPLREPA